MAKTMQNIEDMFRTINALISLTKMNRLCCIVATGSNSVTSIAFRKIYHDQVGCACQVWRTVLGIPPSEDEQANSRLREDFRLRFRELWFPLQEKRSYDIAHAYAHRRETIRMWLWRLWLCLCTSGYVSIARAHAHRRKTIRLRFWRLWLRWCTEISLDDPQARPHKWEAVRLRFWRLRLSFLLFYKLDHS